MRSAAVTAVLRHAVGAAMSRRWLTAVVVAAALTGCAGLKQFPDASPDASKALHEMDPDYEKALAEIYGSADASGQPTVSAEQAKRIRNRLIETRMAVIDGNFQQFESKLAKQGVQTDFVIALLGIGAGAAGALVTGTASQALSAVSGGLAGAQAAYSKAALYDRTMSALLAQMRASRKAVAVQILTQWPLDLDKYPLWLAKMDLDAYYFAGSIPGAILATAGDAKVKDADADRAMIRLREIGTSAVTPEMFDLRGKLEAAINSLSADNAKALVAKIPGAFPEIKPFVDAQYPQAARDADTDGSKAKTVLKRAIVLTVRSADDANKWQSAMLSL